MRQASCGSMTLPIIYYSLFIYLESATAAHVKHLAGHANIIYNLFIYYLVPAVCRVPCAVCRVPCAV
jgi:hypothetical protein